MYSMTGYGKGEYVQDGITLVVEIKTVNNKNFDFNAKMPRSFIAFEDLVRKEVQKNVKRGRIDLFVSFTDTREKETALEVNVEKAMAYYNASKIISEKLGLENDCTVSMIMKSPEVIVDNTLNDFCNKPSYDYPICVIKKDDSNTRYLIDVYTDTKVPNSIDVVYIKYPNKVSLEDNIDCDLPEYSHNEIVQLAVQRYFNAVGSTTHNVE